jgi:hypothetical protein
MMGGDGITVGQASSLSQTSPGRCGRRLRPELVALAVSAVSSRDRESGDRLEACPTRPRTGSRFQP